jgi:CRISPR-associated exonuclease Cas4
MLDETLSGHNPVTPFRVTDLKQWVYCPRILYYTLCLPEVRPTTYKMEAGVEAANQEEGREVRRSLRVFGIERGRREFDVPVRSERLGLCGLVDMVIWPEKSEDIKRPPIPEAIPVDYKLSRIAGAHFKLQLAAYGLLLEEGMGVEVKHGFLYFIPLRKAEKVCLDKRLRQKLLEALDAMHRMLSTERIPESTSKRARCVACEFRRFCNDVL